MLSDKANEQQKAEAKAKAEQAESQPADKPEGYARRAKQLVTA